MRVSISKEPSFISPSERLLGTKRRILQLDSSPFSPRPKRTCLVDGRKVRLAEFKKMVESGSALVEKTIEEVINQEKTVGEEEKMELGSEPDFCEIIEEN